MDKIVTGATDHTISFLIIFVKWRITSTIVLFISWTLYGVSHEQNLKNYGDFCHIAWKIHSTPPPTHQLCHCSQRNLSQWLSTIYPTWTGLGLSPGLCGRRLMTASATAQPHWQTLGIFIRSIYYRPTQFQDLRLEIDFSHSHIQEIAHAHETLQLEKP
jgi:hypothetical protein